MCVIICKRAGLALPSEEVLRKCWNHNSDGFGLAFNDPKDNRVTIYKGAMTLSHAYKIIGRVPKPKKRDMIFHFRIATQGKVAPENCHPFPLTPKIRWLKELNVLTPVAIAHNGVINVNPDGKKGYKGGKSDELSDTQVFIQHYLSGLGTSLLNKQVMKLIHGFAGGKFAILTQQGIRTIGEFEEEDGLLFSNTSWDIKTYNNPTSYGNKLFGACDLCGGFGELAPIVPLIYACRYCWISLELGDKAFVDSCQSSYRATEKDKPLGQVGFPLQNVGGHKGGDFYGG